MKTLSLPHKFIAILAMLFALFGAIPSAQAQAVYALKVGGVTVSPENADNITGPGIRGKVSYNHEKRILTLDNATIRGVLAPAIETKMKHLNIYVIGTCTLKAQTHAALDVENSCLIYGFGGTLNLESAENAILINANSYLELGYCTFNIEGNKGITGVDGLQKEELYIYQANVTVSGAAATISNLSEFTLDCSVIEQPADAVWNEGQHALCNAEGNVIVGEVSFSNKQLIVAGVAVTPENAADITGEGISGKASYDYATKTLTLDNVNITTNGFAIFTGIEGLTIEVVGENTLEGIRGHGAFYCSNSCTIRGKGTLNVENLLRTSAFRIYHESRLTLEDCTVNAKGGGGFSAFSDTGGEVLVIKNAKVTTEEGYAILGLSQLILDGCQITQPAGAVWNNEKQAVCDAEGNVIEGKVVIERIPQGIEGVNAGAARRHSIYNLSGQALGTDFDHLPHGVYIVEGQKVVK